MSLLVCQHLGDEQCNFLRHFFQILLGPAALSTGFYAFALQLSVTCDGRRHSSGQGMFAIECLPMPAVRSKGDTTSSNVIHRFILCSSKQRAVQQATVNHKPKTSGS